MVIVLHDMKDPTHFEQQPKIVGICSERLLTDREGRFRIELVGSDAGNVGRARPVKRAGGEKVAIARERGRRILRKARRWHEGESNQ